MVTALAARWNLGADLYRETQDTDLGSPPAVIQDHDIVGRLTELGYIKTEGNSSSQSPMFRCRSKAATFTGRPSSIS